MKTLSPPHPALDLPPNLYRQLVYTLTDLLPPPLDDSPEALYARNHAAIAKVAALLPVDANEVDLAAQCIAARAQAEDILRLLRDHNGDLALVMRLNAQYASMVRTSLAVHGRLMRVQALRRKRETIDGAASEDARARDIAELAMLKVALQDAEPHQATSPEAARPTYAKEAPVATPAKPSPLHADQTIPHHVSKNGTNSQDAAFETWLSKQPWNPRGSRETVPNNAERKAMAKSRPADHELTANSLRVA